ncbi:hypothetical protein GCM10007862_28720 [Dyella lipolytica]|nr:hypothetical protein GCM10007862_28720 [Dyella lipolytica]
MSISIYYSAARGHPLTKAESSAIAALVDQYAINKQTAKRSWFRRPPNWEAFGIYDRANPGQPNAIFEGSTRLPDNSQEAMWIGLQHWCRLLSEIRRSVAGASWSVHVDDHEIPWNSATSSYDPAK